MAMVYKLDGVPDIIGVYKGRFIAFELKDPNENNTYCATKRQVAQLRRISKAGGVASVVDSLDQVKFIMDKIKDLD